MKKRNGGTPRSSLKRALLSTASTNAVLLLIGVFTGVLTARVLGPHDRGIYVAAILWSGIISSVALAGIDESIIYFAKGRRDSVVALRRQARKAIVAQTAFGTAFVIVALGLTLRPEGAVDWSAVLIAASIVPANAITQLNMVPLRLHASLGAWNHLRLAPQIAYLILIAIMAPLGHLTAWTGLMALGGVNWLTAITSHLIDRRHRLETSTSPVAKGVVTKFGRKLLAGLVPQLLSPRLDQLLVITLLGPASLGVYNVAASVANILSSLAVTFDQVLFPRFASEGATKATTLKVVAVGVGLTFVVACPIALGATNLVRLIYGQEYISAAEPLRVLLLAAICRVAISPVAAFIKSQGAVKHLALAPSLGLATTAITVVMLAPQMALFGVALGSLTGASVTLVYYLVVLRKRPVETGSLS